MRFLILFSQSRRFQPTQLLQRATARASGRRFHAVGPRQPHLVKSTRVERARQPNRRFGGVIVERARTIRVSGPNIRRYRDHTVQPCLVHFRRAQHRTAAIGNANGDDFGIGIGKCAFIRVRRAERHQREIGGLPHVTTPIGFRVIAGMRVFHRNRRNAVAGKWLGAKF